MTVGETENCSYLSLDHKVTAFFILYESNSS